MALYIGLMSGTSLDGIDAVLAELAPDAMRVDAHVHRPFDAALRDELLALQAPGHDELHRAALAANGVALAYAACVGALLAAAHIDASQVRALGAHGQTVRHRPGAFDGHGYSLQLLNAALLAERTGIDVVADLRSRDVAAGGQGAPLVPAFHAWAWGRTDTSRAVLNLGGMANLSLLRADGRVLGFDTGPGGALLDGWCRQHHGTAYDDGGAWAASGRVNDALLRAMLAEHFFAQQPPKSTGRDLFNLAWVDAHLQRLPTIDVADVQSTLAEVTAASIADALRRHGDDTADIVVCGGGARNLDLLARLRRRLPGIAVSTSVEHGMPVDQVEALAFAWLAHRFVEGQPGNVPDVTGAKGARRLGTLTPAR